MVLLEDLQYQIQEIINTEREAIVQIMNDEIEGFVDYLDNNQEDLFNQLPILTKTKLALEDLQDRCLNNYDGTDDEIIDIIYNYHCEVQDYIYVTILQILQDKQHQPIYNVDEIALETISILRKKLKQIS